MLPTTTQDPPYVDILIDKYHIPSLVIEIFFLEYNIYQGQAVLGGYSLRVNNATLIDSGNYLILRNYQPTPSKTVIILTNNCIRNKALKFLV